MVINKLEEVHYLSFRSFDVGNGFVLEIVTDNETETYDVYLYHHCFEIKVLIETVEQSEKTFSDVLNGYTGSLKKIKDDYEKNYMRESYEHWDY